MTPGHATLTAGVEEISESSLASEDSISSITKRLAEKAIIQGSLELAVIFSPASSFRNFPLCFSALKREFEGKFYPNAIFPSTFQASMKEDGRMVASAYIGCHMSVAGCGDKEQGKEERWIFQISG